MARALDPGTATVPAHELLDVLEDQPGIGTTFRAIRRRGGHEEAVTVLDPTLSAERRATLLTALRRQRGVLDDGIDPVLGVSGRGDVAYVATEIPSGERFDEVLARGTLSPAAAVALLAPLDHALTGVRDRGVSTRDLSPARLRVGSDGGLVMTPFALVDPADGDAIVPYRAPELGASAGATAASDVYAIAGLLRTAITGQPPPPWSLQTLPPAASPQLGDALADVLWDGLADDPARRPSTPRELLLRAQDAIVADTAAAEAPPKQRSRKPWLIATGVVAAFLLGTILSSGGPDAVENAPRPVSGLLAAAPSAPASAADPAYAGAQREAMRRLNTRRVARRAQLADAETLRGQARIATSLGDAYGLAARELRRAPAPAGATAQANAGILDALRKVEGAYRTMAAGARDGDRARFVRGRDAVRRREALLQRRLGRLEALGYDVG
ncbi:MAG: hypothetical protein JHC95_14910 [Solirubrobacteraceae bacterium]|nr:hypothetical protein [Solirubrobacteraceae bacterium]